MLAEDGATDPKIIIHVDFDYFYAQCEEIRNPAMKTKPVVICVFSGRTEDSGVVSTANYLARSYGVRSGIPIRLAKSRLASASDAELLPMDLPYYAQVSEKAMSIIRNRPGIVEQVGIDECYVDITSRTNNYIDAEKIAAELKIAVKDGTELSCSVGVGPNKLIAKIASDFVKPDGLTLVRPELVQGFLSQLNVEKIPGIGKKTASRLAELRVKTISDLSHLDQYLLTEEFGKKHGVFLYNASRGIDKERVQDSSDRKQIARIATLKKDATASVEMEDDLFVLCKSVAKIASNMGVSFGNIAVFIIRSDLDQVSKSKSLKNPAESFEVLHSIAKTLLAEIMNGDGRQTARRLGVRVSDFHDSRGQNTMSEFLK